MNSGVRGAGAAVVVVVVALILVFAVRARPAAEPFDPRSGRDDGASALVALLESSGTTVDITRTAPVPGADTRLLVLEDRLDDAQRDATLDFVEAGGLAVVADPASSLHGGPDVDGGSEAVRAPDLPDPRLPVEIEANVPTGSCSIPALTDLRGLHVPDGVLFPVAPDEPQCFDGDGRSFVVVRSIGDGTVVGLGDNEVWVNRTLRRADNAGLAVALLAPDAGTVTVLLGSDSARSPADLGTGDDTLVDLVPAWVWMSLVLAGAAFVVFAASRAVRVGAVLDESLPSPIAGSELVAATGQLMQRAGHAQHAASLLQGSLHRDLAGRLQADVHASPGELDRLATARWGTPPGTVVALLTDVIRTDRELTAWSDRHARFRKDVST